MHMDSSDLNPSQDVVVLMVPFPLQGHLNQLLHLSRLVSAHNITVHYLTTAAQSHQVRKRIHESNLSSISNIIFHDVPSIQYHSPPPNPNAPIKFPSHLQPLIEATSLLREPVKELIGNLSRKNRRVVIIYDSMMGSVVQDFVHFQNAETYTFHSVSAFSIFFFMWEKLGRPFPINEDEKFWNVPPLDGCFTAEFMKYIGNQHDHMRLNSGRIYNTCRVIESQFLEYLERLEISGEKKQWALGPFNPVNPIGQERIQGIYLSNPEERYLNWLDSKPRNSVLFVSFGTTTSLSDEQIKELATGLENSEHNFIWVLREADRGDASENYDVNKDDDLLKGFEERVVDRGIIVRDWAPQLEILGHFATGGFLSHCGWNSCMESMSMGVPIATWPMHSDQPRNAVLITKVLKIGLEVKDWENRDEVVKCSAVERAARRLMASEEGAAMRSRAVDLSRSLKNAMTEGGASRMEMDSFIFHIKRGSTGQ